MCFLVLCLPETPRMEKQRMAARFLGATWHFGGRESWREEECGARPEHTQGTDGSRAGGPGLSGAGEGVQVRIDRCVHVQGRTAGSGSLGHTPSACFGKNTSSNRARGAHHCHTARGGWALRLRPLSCPFGAGTRTWVAGRGTTFQFRQRGLLWPARQAASTAGRWSKRGCHGR